MSKPHGLKSRTGQDSNRGGTGTRGAQIVVRVPQLLADAIDREAAATGRSRSAVVVSMLEQSLYSGGLG